jgi:hypothetical protein
VGCWGKARGGPAGNFEEQKTEQTGVVYRGRKRGKNEVCKEKEMQTAEKKATMWMEGLPPVV